MATPMDSPSHQGRHPASLQQALSLTPLDRAGEETCTGSLLWSEPSFLPCSHPAAGFLPVSLCSTHAEHFCCCTSGTWPLVISLPINIR